ncbi:hypothetical protein MHU86_24380 [Fragilaria crotonensis]|nr:hypothetical protein MHU86_24380 [Fragilaria crotonensis]
MMKSFMFFTLLVPVSTAFQSQNAIVKPSFLTRSSPLHALATAHATKESLISVAERIKSDFGVFVYDSKAKSDLTQAVAELEAVASPPTLDDFQNLYQGDWVLLCTTVATEMTGIDTSKIPFLNEGPLKQARQSFDRSIKVVQRIRSIHGSTTVDRVDHVIEYMPPSTLAEVLENLPDVLKSFNLNPLELTKSTVTLVHKAEVESIIPTLTTKLSLQSVVLNVAGTSQLLDPAGAEILGIDVPFGEFLNTGSFDTTYLDDTLRISRSKLGVVDQLRVFVRAGALDKTVIEEKEASSSDTTDSSDDFPPDMELADVEWVDDDYPSDVEI